ncbi:hypothetical protein RF55_10539 [Lasius niger]|uniref:Uncharacterized protein n=1 Tax=Lasius niger TaxID=67767 RepID=A0A0J7KHQ9_LASNI|nr:hypothetical protein RF55_10539 [Lasius niger]
MADEGQAQIFAAVGHADVRTKDKGFVRLGAVAQAPEITDGSVIRKETTPVGSIVVSQPDVIVPAPPEDIVSLVAEGSSTALAPPSNGQASAEGIQPVLTGSEDKVSQGDALTQPAPGVPETATQPIATQPVAPVAETSAPSAVSTDAAGSVDQKVLKDEIKKEKADQKAAKKDEKRMDELATASANASSSLMVS